MYLTMCFAITDELNVRQQKQFIIKYYQTHSGSSSSYVRFFRFSLYGYKIKTFGFLTLAWALVKLINCSHKLEYITTQIIAAHSNMF